MAIDVYLQIDGIKGESSDSAHQGWIEISSAHMGVTQPRSATASRSFSHRTNMTTTFTYFYEVEMKSKVNIFIIAAAVLPAICAAADEYKPFQATYSIYSGEMGDERGEPTATDRKMAIAVEGRAAKEMFNSMGPDFHPTCSQEKGDRERRKSQVFCAYNARGNAKGYRCWIGINLRTGVSIAGATC